MTSELESLAASCILPGFEGLTAPDWLRSWLERGLGGVVLFGRNVQDVEQLSALTGQLRAEREALVIAIDEEGGDVTRLEAASGSSYPGNHALGAIDDPELTEEVAAAIAADLVRAGVNLDLAPVVDVNSNPDNPVIGIRSFGSDPELVARHAEAFVTGLQRGGVAACAKHFPGHGDTALDSHRDLPVVTADRETLAARELPPFRVAIAAGVRAIMTAHVRVPAYGDEPATLSPSVLQGLLRDELGFTGMAVTDALEMGAIARAMPMEDGAVRALAAGADALCLGADIGDEEVRRCSEAIVAAVGSGRLEEDRLVEAAGRVCESVARLDGSERADRTVGAAAARRALTAEGAARLTRPPLVVELRPEPLVAAGEADHGLGDALRARLPDTRVIRLSEAPADPAAVVDGGGRQLVIVVRDAHRHPWQRAGADSLLRAGGDDAIVVETGIPLWRAPGAAGYVATRGAARVNLDAAAERLAGPS
jgi:beta-N-acetylhexosaminidase